MPNTSHDFSRATNDFTSYLTAPNPHFKATCREQARNFALNALEPRDNDTFYIVIPQISALNNLYWQDGHIYRRTSLSTSTSERLWPHAPHLSR